MHVSSDASMLDWTVPLAMLTILFLFCSDTHAWLPEGTSIHAVHCFALPHYAYCVFFRSKKITLLQNVNLSWTHKNISSLLLHGSYGRHYPKGKFNLLQLPCSMRLNKIMKTLRKGTNFLLSQSFKISLSQFLMKPLNNIKNNFRKDMEPLHYKVF